MFTHEDIVNTLRKLAYNKSISLENQLRVRAKIAKLTGTGYNYNRHIGEIQDLNHPDQIHPATYVSKGQFQRLGSVVQLPNGEYLKNV